MNSAGVKNLGDATITTAVTDSVITLASSGGVGVTDVRGLVGMTKVVAQANFVYGSGGTSVAAVIQTSIDQGSSWLDVIRFDFTTSSRRATAGVGIYATSAATTVTALAVEGVLNNVLGDRLRCKITTAGTYSGNTSLAVRVNVS